MWLIDNYTFVVKLFIRSTLFLLHRSVCVDGFVVSTSLDAMTPALSSLSSHIPSSDSSLPQSPLLSRSPDSGPSPAGSGGSSPSSD